MTITIPGCVSTGAPRRAPPGDASQQLSLVTAGCRATAGHRARLADYGSVSPVYCLLVTVPSCTTCLAPVPSPISGGGGAVVKAVNVQSGRVPGP